MRNNVKLLALLTALFLLPISLAAQGVGLNQNQAGAAGSLSTGDEMSERMYHAQTQKSIAGRIYSSKGGVVAKAGVEITNNAGAAAQYVVTDKEGDFQAGFNLFDEAMGKHFVASLKVTRKGFLPAYKIVVMDASTTNISFAINLRPEGPEDPYLLPQSELLKGLTPRLRQLGPSDGMAPGAQKDYARGVQDFFDKGHVDRAVLDFEKVASLSPECLKCRTMLGLTELSWGDWDDAQREFMAAVNAIIKDQKLGSPEPLIAYGVFKSWLHDPAKASAYFLDALTYAPKDPLALQELGRSQCQEMNWYAANITLKRALAAGAGPEAKLLRAEALLWAGTPQEASDELNNYMDGRPFKSMPSRVQVLQANIQIKFKDAATFEAATYAAKARGEEPLDYIHHAPTKNLQSFVPATDQAPIAAILAAVGKNVAGLFTDLPNICAVEKVHQEKLDHKGRENVAQDVKFRYLALIPDHPWGPSVDEYRADSTGRGESQMDVSENSMLTEGFISAPLVFHPAYQEGGSFVLLGSQMVKGRKTFVVAYAQIPAKTSLYGTFAYGHTTRMTYTQGMAWIDAENYQIVRITSDLLQPLPEVRLEKETTDIVFSEVQFKQGTQRFWLPEAVTVSLDWNGRSYRNHHTYSEFLLSNVDEKQKIGKPKEAKKTTVDANEGEQKRNTAQETASPSTVPEAN